MTGLLSSSNASPFAKAAYSLAELGYHVIPIIPPGVGTANAGKSPGNFRFDTWHGLHDWQRFRDRVPSEFELGLWARNFPDANIGIVCGTPAGDQHKLIAVDIDVTDRDELELLLSVLPRSPMAKRGRKGQTLFFRAPADVQSKNYDRMHPSRMRLVDLLTGNQTRQTVAPPSLHADNGRATGAVYTWLSGPVAPADLPLFDADAMEKLEDTLRGLGWDRDASHKRWNGNTARAAPQDPSDDIWSETKGAALADLDRWVPTLGLYNLRKARRGYEAVATWRASSSGRPTDQRKRNLSIQPNGIKDFGTDETYSAIDLVMAALSLDVGDATLWLRDRMALTGALIVLDAKQNPEPRDTEHTLTQHGTPELVDAHIEREAPIAAAPAAHVRRVDKTDEELPLALTRTTGLLGAMVDWIADSARRPQRGLALGAALAIMAGAAGRRYGGPTGSGTHLYILGLARTSAGKDHPLQSIARALLAAGLKPRIGPSQFMSMSAVINRITREPVTVAAIDELGSFLGRINSRRSGTHEKAITGVLRSFWGASFETVNPPEWAGRVSEPIHSPALSIFGVSTHEEFYAGLEGGDVHNGFLNRFLLLSTRHRPAEVEPDRSKEPPASVVAGLTEIASGNPLHAATSNNGQADGPEIAVPWHSKDAQDCYRAFGREIEARETEMAFLARTVEMALRLATIKAIGDDPITPTISVSDMEWGRAVALWSAERMIAETRDFLAETQNQADKQLVLRLLREADGGMPHAALVRQCGRMKNRDLKDLLQMLEDGNDIISESRSTGGRPSKTYFLRV